MTTIKEASADKLYGFTIDFIIIDDVEFDIVQQEDIKEKEVKSNKPYWRSKERW